LDSAPIRLGAFSSGSISSHSVCYPVRCCSAAGVVLSEAHALVIASVGDASVRRSRHRSRVSYVPVFLPSDVALTAEEAAEGNVMWAAYRIGAWRSLAVCSDSNVARISHSILIGPC
jgi:hypothetical protein